MNYFTVSEYFASEFCPDDDEYTKLHVLQPCELHWSTDGTAWYVFGRSTSGNTHHFPVDQHTPRRFWEAWVDGVRVQSYMPPDAVAAFADALQGWFGENSNFLPGLNGARIRRARHG